jgi:hypothetical protein
MSPGQAEPRYDGRAQSRPPTEEESARAEALRKWKEGDSNLSKSEDHSTPSYRTKRLGSSTLLEQWQLKAGISLAITVMLLIPYFSWIFWFILLPPLRVLVPSSPSLQLDVLSGNFHEPTIWGSWFLGGGGFFPWPFGFLLFFTYFYFLANMFIPEYKMKQLVFITILWVWFFISWVIGMPPSPFEWFFTDI